MCKTELIWLRENMLEMESIASPNVHPWVHVHSGLGMNWKAKKIVANSIVMYRPPVAMVKDAMESSVYSSHIQMYCTRVVQYITCARCMQCQNISIMLCWQFLEM